MPDDKKQQTLNGDDPKKETAPTKYCILYRLESDPKGQYREATLPPKGDDPEQLPERLVVEAKGQSEARKAFFEQVKEQVENDDIVWWPHDEEYPAQVAAVAFSSWQPRGPRQRTITTWE